MRTNAEFHNCAESGMVQVREHWTAKGAYLDKRMKMGSANPEEAQLDLHVCCQPWADRYAVQAVLSLSSKRLLVAEALDENVMMAVDRVAELLAQAVQEHRDGTPALAERIDEVEEASAGSFPASDAPAWTQVTTRN